MSDAKRETRMLEPFPLCPYSAPIMVLEYSAHTYASTQEHSMYIHVYISE